MIGRDLGTDVWASWIFLHMQSDGTPLPQPQLAPASLPGFALAAAPYAKPLPFASISPTLKSTAGAPSPAEASTAITERSGNLPSLVASAPEPSV